MIHKTLGSIVGADLDDLVTGGRAEGTTLDYKSELPGGSDDEKRKFLFDVAAMANTRGGDIIYGIEEESQDGRNTGIPRAVIGVATASRDAEALRLDSIIRSAIDPRIPGIDMRWIPNPSPDRQTLVLRVPRSALGPHMVTFKGASKFYARATNGNYEMDVRGIRAAYELSGDLGRRLREFRADRLMQIESERPRSDDSRSRLVFHVVPISALETGAAIDLAARPDVSLFLDEDYAPSESRFNVDGYYRAQPDVSTSILVLRQGVIEVVDGYYMNGGVRHNLVASLSLERTFIFRVRGYVAKLQELGAQFPMFLAVAILGAKDRALAAPSDIHLGFANQNAVFDRDRIVLPEHMIESLDAPELWSVRLKPVLDSIWQAAGLAGSPYFTDGRWRPGRGQY